MHAHCVSCAAPLTRQCPCTAGLEFHKSKGQHILKNPQVVKSIVDKASKSTRSIKFHGMQTTVTAVWKDARAADFHDVMC